MNLLGWGNVTAIFLGRIVRETDSITFEFLFEIEVKSTPTDLNRIYGWPYDISAIRRSKHLSTPGDENAPFDIHKTTAGVERP